MKISLGIKLGIVAGIINCIAWYGFAKSLGFYSLSIYSYRYYLTLLLIIAGIFLSIFFERKKNLGFIEFKVAAKVGILFSLMLGGTLALFNVIYNYFIVNDAIDYFASEEKNAWLAHGKTAEETSQYISQYYIPSFGSFHVLMNTIIIGILFSFLLSAVLRKKNPHPFNPN